MQFSGHVVKDGRVVAARVRGTAQLRITQGDIESWVGEFTVPTGRPIDPDEYELRRDDGKVVGIRVLNNPRPGLVEFKSNGPWL
jgi:hypothetical protein